MLSSSASSDASASRNCSRPRNSLFWLRKTSHRTHSSGRETPPTERTLLVEKHLPQNARNAQNLLAEKYLPQIGTDAHRLGGYGILPYPRCLRNPIYTYVGEQTQPSHLCKSVNSVGGPTQQNFCEFCEFRGRINATKHLCKSVKSVGGLMQPNSHETCGKMAILSRLVQLRPLHPI